MKKQLYVTIPTPCHENWDNMTPAGKGRFCQSCAKQVVDFSGMTDSEILHYFSKAAGNTCGRFANDQLQRPLQPLTEEKRKAWRIAAMMPLLMMFEKGKAQGGVVLHDSSALTNQQCQLPVMGKVAAPRQTQRTIYGRVTNEAGQPVPFASVMINGKYDGVEADSLGAFNVVFSEVSEKAELEVSAVGYESARAIIASANEYVIVLHSSENNLEPIAVTAYSGTKCHITMGTGSIINVEYLTVKDTIRNIFFLPSFKIFPNPAQRGGKATIDVKKEGNYSIQLFDNSGKPIIINQFTAVKGSTQTSVTIPSSAAAAMYYIRLINEKTKKQYTDKMVVM